MANLFRDIPFARVYLVHVIKNIIEDRDGNMWFGTSGGVTKYDGRYFTNYSKKNGLIDDNVLLPDGR